MTKAITEVFDKTDLAEYANAADCSLGVVPMDFGVVRDTEFLHITAGGGETHNNRIAYVDSEHLGYSGFYHAEQGLGVILGAIYDCIANQEYGVISEFVIPINPVAREYLYIRVGEVYVPRADSDMVK